MSKEPALKPWTVSSPVPPASLTSLLFVVVIVGCVYVGREVLVPIALAILLSFALRSETLDCELTCASGIIDEPFVRCRDRRLRLRGAGSAGTHSARDPFKLRAPI